MRTNVSHVKNMAKQVGLTLEVVKRGATKPLYRLYNADGTIAVTKDDIRIIEAIIAAKMDREK